MNRLVLTAGLSLVATMALGDGVMEPRGELAQRIDLARDRMLHGEAPAFTDDFILADVALKPDYPRRFSNYSGDLSGRYIGAMAMMPDPEARARLKRLVAAALAFQKPDGRFGSMDLEYTADAIGLDHMALLWGNGRLLVGLLEYYAFEPDPAVLDASRKLGGFLRSVHDSCANEAVQERVKDLAAAGMICFSQLIEGQVMLAEAAGDKAYLEDAGRVAPWLPRARGQQHSHGYLTTLRGMVMLSEATGNPAYLDEAAALYGDLIASDDYTIYGGVQEYFGGKGASDEGCSEADFLRLALQLWQATGSLAYLDQAEYCLLNQFCGNQFATGDFGHHVHFERGIQPSPGVGRAWWCCTMHGLRALRDVADLAVTADDVVRVNLFVDGRWTAEGRALELGQDPSTGKVAVSVHDAPTAGFPLALRRPSWAESMTVTVNGQAAASHEEAGYLVLDAPVRKGDVVEGGFTYKVRILRKDHTELPLSELTSKAERLAVVYGPWLLGVDEADNSQFFGEPWTENEVLLPAALESAGGPAGPFTLPVAHVPCTYTHGGFPGALPLTLRPFSECTGHGQSTFAVWLNYRRAG